MKTVLSLCTVLFLAFVSAMPAAPIGMSKRLIEQFHMERIPDEGPWFTVTYTSQDSLPGALLPARYDGRDHAAGSAIYCVITQEDFSALHRLQTDETWHFYGGDPLEMLLLYPDGHAETVILGPDVFAGQRPQFTVPRGVWQGAAPTCKGPESYSFIGDQLAPAFDYHDFEIGYRDELQKAYPKFSEQIERLTRMPFAIRPVGTAPVSPLPTPTIYFPPAIVLSESAILPPVEIAPGMFLQELAGRTGIAKSKLHSVARFKLTKGHSTLISHNKVSEETFLVIRGHGQVMIEKRPQPIGPGSFVMMEATVSHQVIASADEDLEFYAIESPAYSPADFVAEPEQK